MPQKDVQALVDKLKTQKGIKIDHTIVKGANHFFDGKVETLMTASIQYLENKRLVNTRKPTAA